jgi:hypothetical protein
LTEISLRCEDSGADAAAGETQRAQAAREQRFGGPSDLPPPAAPSMKRAQLWRTLDEIDDSRARAASGAARVRAVSR